MDKRKKRVIWSLLVGLAFLASIVYVLFIRNFGAAGGTIATDSWERAPNRDLAGKFETAQSGRVMRSEDERKWVFQVAPGLENDAVGMLKSQDCVPLTKQEAERMSGHHLQYAGREEPYLVRAFAGPTIVRQYHGALWVDCGILTHESYVRPGRSAVIILAVVKPKDVYLTFSAAE